MASENFLLNFDINLSNVEAKFQNFVNKTRQASAEIANIPVASVPAVSNVRGLAESFGTRRQGIREEGRVEGTDSKVVNRKVRDLEKEITETIDGLGLTGSQVDDFRSVINTQAAETKKNLTGLTDLTSVQQGLAAAMRQQTVVINGDLQKITKPLTPANDVPKANRTPQQRIAAVREAEAGSASVAEQARKNAEAMASNTKAVETSTVNVDLSTKKEREASAEKLAATARETKAVEKRLLQLEAQSAAAKSPEVTSSRINTTADVNKQTAAVKAATVATEQEVRDLATASQNRKVTAERVKQMNLASTEYTQSTLKTALARDEEARATKAAVNADLGTQANKIRASETAAVSRASITAANNNSPAVQGARLEALRTKQTETLRARLQIQGEALGLDRTDLLQGKNLAQLRAIDVNLKTEAKAAKAQEAAAAKAAAAAEKARLALTVQGGVSGAARAASEKQIAANLKAVAAFEGARLPETIASNVARLQAEKENIKAIRQATAAEIRRTGGTNLAAASARLGLTANSGLGGGVGTNSGRGFLAGGALSSLKFGLPSLALFQGGSLLIDSLKDAEELERLLLQLENQLQVTVGPTRATAEFERLQQVIKDTSREVGLAGSEVAGFAIQFQGAFGEGTGKEIEGQSGTDLVESQVFDASRFARISNLDDEVVFDDFSAASIAFEASAETIANAAFGAQDAAGVAADEIVNFLGKIAPVAESAGFSLEEFAAISATAQQASGASGDVLAEQFGRIIPAVSGARVELLQLAQTNDALNQQPFLDALATNDVAGIIRFLIAEYDNLGEAAQNSAIELLGGRREAAALISVFENSDTFERTLDSLGDTAGRLDERFEAFSGTFGQQIARLSQSFRQLLLALLDAGLADFFSLILESLIDATEVARTLALAFSGLVSPLAPVLDGLREMNEVLGGIPAKIALIGLALKAAGIGPGFSGAAAALGTAVSLPGSAPRAATSVASGFIGPSQFAGPVLGPAVPAVPVSLGTKAKAALASPALAAAAVGAAITATVVAYNEITKQQEINANQAEDLLTKLQDVSDEELQRLINDTPKAGRIKTGFSSLFGIEDARDFLIEYQNARGEEALTNSLEELIDTDDGLDELIDFVTSEDRNTSLQDALINSAKDQALTPEDLQDFNDSVRGNVFDFSRAGVLENGGAANITVNTELFKSEDFIRNAIEQAKLGNKQALIIVGLLEGVVEDEALNAELQEVLAERGPAYERALQILEQSTASLEEAKSGYDLGTGSLTTLLAAMDANIANLEGLIASEEADQDDVLIFAEGLAKLKQERDKAYADASASQVELANKVIALREGDTVEGNQQQLDNFIGQLNDPEFTNPDARLKAAEGAIAVTQAFAQAEIDALDDGFEKAALLTSGVEIPQEARIEILLSQLNQNNEAYSAFTDAYVAVYGESAEGFTRSLIAVATLGEEGAALAEEKLKLEIARAEAYVSASLSLGPNAADGGASLSAARDLLKTLRDQLGADSPGDLWDIEDVTTIGADPKAGAEAAKKAAEAAAATAEAAADERAKAAEELLEAQNAYLLAIISGDPVKVAQEQLRQAQEAISKASTEAERIRAQIDVLNSERALEQAFRDIGTAQTDLLIAQAEASGRTVDAAQLSFEAAQENLRQVQQDFANGNAGEAGVLAAEAAAVRAEANARDVSLSSQVDEYEYLNEIGAITNQQLIQYLQQLKTVPGLIPDQLRDLDRKIKELNSEIGQDLQFNLPTNIAVPTLFETRRLNQSVDSNGAGQGYQDNRVVSIQLNVNGNTDPDQLVSMLDEYLGNNRSTVSVRRY